MSLTQVLMAVAAANIVVIPDSVHVFLAADASLFTIEIPSRLDEVDKSLLKRAG